MQLNHALQLIPEYRDYVWGGDRLIPGMAPVAEAWVVYEHDRVETGPLAGQTLAELVGQYGAGLLGRRVVARTGLRFPLLIKLLDCAQWLSLQVHPNDEQARRLEGPGHFGKTEAWHIIDDVPGARLIAGLQPGTSREEMAEAIRNGTILEKSQYLDVAAGDTIFIRPGTIHALGPGLLIYEVQQTSDLTYRVWDWDRPQTAGRLLHVDKSLAVADPSATSQAQKLQPLSDGGRQVLCHSDYFTLELLCAQAQAIELDTVGETFHALTVIEGAAQVLAGGQELILGRFQSAVIPAACGAYSVRPLTSYRMLKASVD